MNLIIDIGNTVAKLAAFDGDELLEVVHDSNETLEHLPAFCRKYPFRKAILATVIDLTADVQDRLKELPIPLLYLGADTPLPVENLYETPRTLGYDRMAAVVGANALCPGRDLLVIDAGTCITSSLSMLRVAIMEATFRRDCRCVSRPCTSLPAACPKCKPRVVCCLWARIPIPPSVPVFCKEWSMRFQAIFKR